ncbi:MAG: tRNA lysidine(34) synthetase TilS [Paracoccus sp. (in: a-proteobacteria)]|nr:tRNA lysidine(34) synthetase TilS [Paracoccus sp. (in: a-proteobacteria)]
MADLRARVFAALNDQAKGAEWCGVAVSGGGDSMALLHLAAGWARDHARPLEAATVDHGLRPQARAEAETVARACASLGIPHSILTWRDHGTGNLMARAREARMRLLADWARGRHADPAILLGHTRDDQAETLLMRLMRGAGLDGLAAMQPARRAQGALWLRPLLGLGRAELRDWLRAQGIGWIDDPSNDDDRFDRARARKTIATLGLNPAALAQSARLLGESRDDLAALTWDALRDHLRIEAGDVILPADLIARPELTRRITLAALRFLNGPGYPPRATSVARFIAAARTGKAAVLNGVRVEPGADWRFMREPAACTPPAAAPGEWDRRWRITGPQTPGITVAAMGRSGLAALKARNIDWRASGLPYGSALTSPGLWQRETLIGAPLLAPDLAPDWRATPLHTHGDFAHMLFLH